MVILENLIDFIMKIKRFITIILIVTLGTIIYFYFYLPIPNFIPKKEVLKKVEDKNITIEWNRQIGILDQKFPDYITMQRGKILYTVCKAHNIADININDGNLVIGFYGNPKYNPQCFIIPEKIFEYKIIIDSSFTAK
jgi:hypothetical protein